MACKTFKSIERADLIKRLSVEFDGGRRGKNTGTAAARLFGFKRMGRAVRPQKKAWVAGCRGRD
jgi:hypothetical protein